MKTVTASPVETELRRRASESILVLDGAMSRIMHRMVYGRWLTEADHGVRANCSAYPSTDASPVSISTLGFHPKVSTDVEMSARLSL